MVDVQLNKQQQCSTLYSFSKTGGCNPVTTGIERLGYINLSHENFFLSRTSTSTMCAQFIVIAIPVTDSTIISRVKLVQEAACMNYPQMEQYLLDPEKLEIKLEIVH